MQQSATNLALAEESLAKSLGPFRRLSDVVGPDDSDGDWLVEQEVLTKIHRAHRALAEDLVHGVTLIEDLSWDQPARTWSLLVASQYHA
jgi:hypothetical protein